MKEKGRQSLKKTYFQIKRKIWNSNFIKPVKIWKRNRKIQEYQSSV